MSAGTILVVDYRPEIVDFAKAALARSAFDVLAADCAEQALGILDARPDVDLVISEALLPTGISGLDLVRRVRQSFPSTAVLVMTGFTDTAVDPAIPLLQKPFLPATLIDRVKQVLADSKRHEEELQESCRKLEKTFHTASGLLSGVDEAVRATRAIRLESARQRAAWLCSRLREADVPIPTILVAEDDPGSRSAVCRFLIECGLTVLEAGDGAEALQVARAQGGHIDMLVTDVEMPGLDGVDLANTMAKECPRTDIVFMTGDDRTLPYPAVLKPFLPVDLLAAMANKLLLRMRTPAKRFTA